MLLCTATNFNIHYLLCCYASASESIGEIGRCCERRQIFRLAFDNPPDSLYYVASTRVDRNLWLCPNVMVTSKRESLA